VRGYRATTLELYRDGDGVHWLGSRTRDPAGAWSEVQPVTGPLAPRGLDLAGLTATGQRTTDPASVTRVVAAITARSSRPVGFTAGSPRYLTAALTVQLAPRNGA